MDVRTFRCVQDLAEQAIDDFLADGRAIVRQLFAEA